jgi:hypothetical protein
MTKTLLRRKRLHQGSFTPSTPTGFRSTIGESMDFLDEEVARALQEQAYGEYAAK